MQEWLEQLVVYVVLAIQAVGVAVVIWGVVEALVSLVRPHLPQFGGPAADLHFGDIRIRMGTKMVLALEFFIASDIIQTVLIPSWQSLAILAGIVAIRTVIAYFLEYEIRMGLPGDSGAPRT